MTSPPFPCSETETEQGPWWKAHFVDNYFTVDSVKLLSRNIGDTSKMAELDIYINDVYCASTPSNPASIQQGTWYEFKCEEPTVGNQVMLKHSKYAQLAFCGI